jgi:cytochrome b561
MRREASQSGSRRAFISPYAVLITEGTTGAVASYLWWPISAAHVILFKVLLALVTIHVAAALWHELVRKDAVMRRMGLGTADSGRRAIQEANRRRT